MKLVNPSICLAYLFLCGLSLCQTAQAAPPTGAMGFLTTPTTVTAGDAGSWIRPLWDWNNRAANSVASPDVPRQFQVTSARDAGHLIIHVVIADATQTRLPGNGALNEGDQIVIHINPNNSKSVGLQSTQGDPFNTDHRYVIRLNQANPDPTRTCEIRHDTPFNDFGTMVWDTSSAYSSCPVGNWNFNANSNDVTIRIPLSDLGFGASHPVADFGLAIAFINDLGVDDPNNGKAQLTSSAFPLALPISNTNNPVDRVVVAGPFIDTSGVWSQPQNWGVGYTSTVPLTAQNVVLEHGPEVWLASAIRLSRCDVGSWDDVAAAQWDQSTLQGWYKYYPDAPTCQMGVWVKAKNFGQASVAGRLLILWADAGLGQNAWRTVKLTEPMVFAGPNLDSITRQIWANVPAGGSFQNGTTHPCLRVYVLPKDLNKRNPNTPTGTLIDAAYLAGIDQNSDIINQMEQAYGMQPYPNNPQAAQMNFTNLAPQGQPCPGGNQCQFASLSQPMYASLDVDSFLPRSLAQTTTDAKQLIYVRDGGKPAKDKEEPIVRVHIMGFGIEPTPQQQHYVFVEPLGGLAWAGTRSDMAEHNLKAIPFGVTNPSVLFRDFSKSIPKDIPSPARKIVLSAFVKSDSGELATIKLLPTKEVLEPGETMVANAVVAVTPIKPPCPRGCGTVSCPNAGTTLQASDNKLAGTEFLWFGMAGVGAVAFTRRRRDKSNKER